ncbi:MAG: phosphoribosylformylglycinamidine synthase subunit PurS [Planctomycetes bacterium]|nr:phosphoribosylformylglycinamidine synthase subunit PurS [Planctomycetota bacterium]
MRTNDERKAFHDSIWRVAVSAKDPRPICVDRFILGWNAVGDCDESPTLIRSRVFYLRGPLDLSAVSDIARRLLCDAVVETYEISGQQSAVSSQHLALSARQPFPTIEILPKPGVMDPAALSAEQAIRDLGFDLVQVRTGRRYLCENVTELAEVRRIAENALANTLIEEIHCSAGGQDDALCNPFVEPAPQQQEPRDIPLREADDDELCRISKEGHLFLNVEEMRAIRDYYRRLERDPTDVELETLAQTWSEHCVHKTMKSEICYRGASFPEELRITNYELRNLGSIERKYGNLLGDTIVAATRELNKSWCLSVFEDNAGIIEFDERHGVAFKVETHNHPSALAPYGGAATGIGGCIRDIMGCGLGAKPIANTDVFCFAEPDLPAQRIPAGVIHPARSMREVVRGVRDYGNRMGIPTVNGAIVFDNRYLGNPLVYCGCVGLLPKDRIRKAPLAGDRVVVVGGRTGRDGIHGATFSSGSMSDTHADEFAHAVQIGNAITEKKVLDVLLQARDHAGGCLYRSITDCGAGGLSSAVGEMAEELGAVVELEKVPLKYAGLRYDEIWISEAQERMVLAVAPENVDELIELCAAEDVEATDIGRFSGDGKLVLKYDGTVVGELDMQFLHNGLPKTVREATWHPTNAVDGARVCESARAEARGSLVADVRASLLAHLGNPNIASKEWVIRQYDHEVQGGSVIKPLMGPGRGPSDGAVVRPLPDSNRGIALSCGLCPHLSDVDPYLMAVAAVDEAVRNNLCVGGNLDRLAILDNFCWGGVSEPAELGALVRASQACHDAAIAYGIPFISGKDSLNNVFDIRPDDARQMDWPARISIPDTLLISALSVVDDVTRCRTSDLKRPGNILLLVQPTGCRLADLAGAARDVFRMLRDVDGVRSCHDVSDGGWLVAAAEMAIGSRYGVELERADADYFTEQLGSYLMEVTPQAVAGLSRYTAVGIDEIGKVIEAPVLCVGDGGQRITWEVDALRSAWRKTFDWE